MSMKWSWDSIFGSSSMELPSFESAWKTMTADTTQDVTYEVRMVTDKDKSYVQMVFGHVTVTLKNTEAIDNLVNQLIKMRDLMEKVKQ